VAGHDARDALRRVAAGQAGVVHRRQALDAGLASSTIGRLTRTGRWRTLLPGVYAVHEQPVDDLGRVWAAVLYVGRGDQIAMASGSTALWLAGVLDCCPAVVEVATTASRRVRRQPGVRIRLRSTVAPHPTLLPPRERLEEALLDMLGLTTRPEQVVDLVLRAGQRRLTTPARLRAAAAGRRRLRWRRLLEALCGDLADGVHSVLERVYRRDVERAHGLPRGTRNRPEPGSSSSWYRDVRYRPWRVLVELDGRGAHPVEEAFRDRRRDNWAARAGEVPLRYGWREVVGAPCEVAAEVAEVLRSRGWSGQLRACGSGCTALPSQGEDLFPPTGNKSSA
jgi:hypothetical protein